VRGSRSRGEWLSPIVRGRPGRWVPKELLLWAKDVRTRSLPLRGVRRGEGRAGLLLAVSLAIGVGVSPSVVVADVEGWSSFEFRLPLAQRWGPAEQMSLRLVYETRFRERSGGLGQMLVRVGPRFDLCDWFFVALQPALYVERGDVGEFLRGVRVEVEPTFQFDLGSLVLSDRSRIAYRWETDDITWYYRNMLRVEYDVGPLLPFVWGEPLLEVRSLEIDEYRLMAGVQVKTSESTDIELGYLHRARKDASSWVHDHVVAFYVIFNGWDGT
jgi:hypothetical protein